MTEDKGLMFAGEALIAIVEGIRGAMKHGTWRDDKGMRLKDTNEWVLFYTVFCSRRRPSPNHPKIEPEPNELLREALEFYADELTWADTNPKDDDRLTVLVPSPSFAEIDRGKRARDVLKAGA